MDAGEGDAVVPELEPELLPLSMGWTTGFEVDAAEGAALVADLAAGTVLGAGDFVAAFGCFADGRSDSGASCATTKEEHSATKAPPISR